VFAQVMGKGAEHAYKVVLIKEVIASDLNLEVSFLPIQTADMGGGLIWRATDDRNYYLARATRWNKIFECIGSKRSSTPVTKLRPDD